MKTYLIERNLPPGMTDKELEAAAQRSLKTLAEMPDVTWVRSFLTTEKNKFVCIYQAPSAEECLEHARKADLPMDKISEVNEITPDMFKGE